MKANELRIGNWLKNSEGYFQVDCSFFDQINCDDLGNGYEIPLTEEWLLKFGFEKNRNYKGNQGDKSAFSWFINNDEFLTLQKFHCGKGDEGQTFFPTISYMNRDLAVTHVHQLQNLYFALTGQELEIQENNES